MLYKDIVLICLEGYGLESEVVASVEGAVADGFHDVGCSHAHAGFQIGDGACHLEDAVVGACAHIHALDGVAQQLHSLAVGLRPLVEHGGGHLGIAVYAGGVLKAHILQCSGLDYALAYALRRFAGRFICQFIEIHRLHFNLEVNAVGYYVVRFSC